MSPPQKKHILLIAYVFPPYYGVGGRRWAKHAVELTKLDYTVHVICAKNPFPETSLWWDIVKDNPNIILHQLPRRYPKVMVNFSPNFFQKIFYKLWIILLPLLTKGSYLDRTIFWKGIMLRTARKVIRKHNIRHVICTGGPFGAMYFTTLLKRWFRDIFIINDLRDPWTWGPNWGFPSLNAKRMAYEKHLEKETIKNSDIISAPSDDMLLYLKKHYPAYSHKFKRIPHFYDESELSRDPKTPSDKIRMIMYGNLYHGIEAYIEKTAEIFAAYKNAITLDIYTDKLQHRKTFSKYGADNVTFHSQVPAKELFDKFKDYDYVFLFNPAYNVNNISTKFYEIIYTRTPIIMFCEDGLGPQFLVNNKLGIHIDLESAYKTIHQLVEKKLVLDYNSGFNISEYSIKHITENISTTLKEAAFFDNRSNIRNLLFTFDYELFLGKNSGTVDNCILKPTAMMLDILKQYQITNSIFFVDTVYLNMLQQRREPMAVSDLHHIKKQLSEIIKNGHIIFPHIHPHWLDAVYDVNTNQWHLDKLNKYRFHNVDAGTRKKLFTNSIDFIKQVQDEAGIHYPISGFRAGGWCIQPFMDFKPFFLENGMKYDFSVLKHFRFLSDTTYYDFTKVPHKPVYHFEDDVNEEKVDGSFTEYSVSWLKESHASRLFNKFVLKYLYLLKRGNFGDGMSVQKTEDRTLMAVSESADHNKSDIEMASLELITVAKIGSYKRMLRDNAYSHFITHPKMLSGHNIRYFKKFLKHARSKYELQTDFHQMK